MDSAEGGVRDVPGVESGCEKAYPEEELVVAIEDTDLPLALVSPDAVD
jgi:hypothetical protein